MYQKILLRCFTAANQANQLIRRITVLFDFLHLNKLRIIAAFHH
jgi:hypothetical protein